MRLFRQHLVLIVLIIVVLAACDTPTPVRVPTITPTIGPTRTLTPTAAPLHTATPLPPAATPSTMKGPQVIEFSLGEATIIQPLFPQDSKFYAMPLRLNGVIAVPAGSGPFPVVVLMHGRHGICPEIEGQDSSVQQWPCEDEQPNYTGFGYLASALAARGYLAMAINVNAAYTTGWGEDPGGVTRFPQIVDLYLASLAMANSGTDVGFDVPLAGKADLSRIAFVAHSQSGALATHDIRARASNTGAEPIAQGFGPIGAILYLSPAYDPSVEPVPDVPLGVLLPSCDNDLSDLPGQRYYEAARLTPQRQSFAATVYLAGANHNFFNSILKDEAQNSQRPGCSSADRLTGEEQRAFLAQYAPDFMDAAFGTKVYPEEAGLDAFVRAPDRLYGYRVLTSLSLPSARRRIVLLPAETNRFQNSFGQLHQLSGPLTADFCGTDQGCLTWPIQPGQSDQLRLSWTGPRATFSTALPSEAQDLSKFDMLHLRALVDPTAFLNAPRLPQSFGVILQDMAGLSSTVAVSSKTPALGYQPGAPSTTLYGWNGLAPMSSIRIPLSDFKGIDLRHISSIGLALDGQPTGSILIADLEFLSKAPSALQTAPVISGVISAAEPLTIAVEPVADTAGLSGAITGTITYLQRIALPEDAQIEVLLVDTSAPDAATQLVGQQLITANGQQVPIAYTLEYSVEQIDPARVYTLQARIALGNQPLFDTPQPIPVLTAGNRRSNIEIVVQPAR